MIITKTPMRISFFGGGTDYPVWYREHGGAVLSTTIDKCCYITCRYLPPFFEYHSRISYTKVENVAANNSIEHPSVRACLQYLNVEDGVEIHHVADLPARTGLGTSSAFTVGLLLGLYALKDQMRDKHALAADAIEVEQKVLQEAVGAQDQVSAAYGGFNRINFHQDDTVEVKRVLCDKSRIADLNRHLALYFTGFSRIASEIAQAQIKATPNKTNELRTMLQMVDEAESIAANPGRSLADFGHLLHESWRLKRSLTHNITNQSIDEIYEAGRSAGALGGKLLGAGGGGFMLFFVAPEKRDALRQRLKNLLCVPMSFNNRGSQVIVHEPEDKFDEGLSHKRREVYAHK
jgi:D-glycero-alpha-D-manno-heptose-7-phosphate kinase